MADNRTSNCVLPPSPNWYCSSAADFSATGIYVFVAKRRVYLVDVSCEPPAFRGQFVGHEDRVSAVSCCPHQLYSTLCASGSDDKTVKIWDIETRLVAASHNAHQAKITCLCWSPIATDLVISADEKGMIIAWRYNKNVVYSGYPIQEYIFSVSASCHSEQQAAAGYKNGLIVVLNLDENGITVTHRLRGHDGDVHSIAWCPVSAEHLDLGPLQKKALSSQGNLIMSGSRDQTIRLWDTLNGKLISIFNLPKRSSQKWRDKHDWQSKDRLWLAVCWPASLPNKMITSSHSGELLLWDLSVASGPEQVQSFGHGHSRIVFNICCNSNGTKIVSCSMDRQVIVWDLQTLRSLHSIPTLGGFVYALDISPLDPGTLAVGVGDNMIRIWNTASTSSPYDAVTLWQGIKSKVQMVSWHPYKEGWLAFGTDGGQVGIYNTVSKKPEVFACYHKKAVYSLSWGPPCPGAEADRDESLSHIYSCGGDGSVFEHRPGHPMQDAVDVNALIKKTNDFKHKFMCRTDVAWNSTGTALALGNDDGTIEIFTPPSLRRVCTISVHKKIITCLSWHHGYGDDSADVATGEGQFSHWLASGSNESTVHIHDLSNVLQSTNVSVDSPPITSSYRQLVGHCGRITALSWCPHHCNMIASGSYDGTAQTWNVEKSQPLANFRGHVGRVMSVRWSYLDPDVVYSGGEDGTVRPWSVSTQHHTQPPVTERQSSRGGNKSSRNKKKSKPKNIENTEVKEREELVLETNVEKERPQNGIRETSESSVSTATNVASWRQDALQELSWRRDASQDLSWRQPRDAAIGLPQSLSANQMTSDDINDKLEDFGVMQPRIDDDDDDDDASSTSTLPTQEPTHVVSRSKGDAGKKKKKVKSMFPLSAVGDNKSKSATQQECIALAQYVGTPQVGASEAIAVKPEAVVTKTVEPAAVVPEAVVPGESRHVNLGFFADRRSAYKMIATEGRHHSSANNLDYQLQLEVWKGNLGGALEMAIKAKQLSDWLVALSPLAGHDVWLNTAELFADQLASQGSHQRAVLYYLSCHKVYRAIEVYKTQSMFREAIGLAKVRLSPSDQVLNDLYCSWARKLETENAYEQAAKCYIAAYLPVEAVRILSTRGDYSSLSTALQVSVSFGQHQLASSLAVRVLHICLATGNWDDAHKALDMCTGVEGHLYALCVHELLVVELLSEGLITDDEFKEKNHSETFSSTTNGEQHALICSAIENNVTGKPVKTPWFADTPNNDWFVVRVLMAWARIGLATPQRDTLQTAIQQLTSYSHSNLNENLSTKRTLIRISYDVALGLLRGIHQDTYHCALPWLQAVESCCKCNFLELAQSLCVHLLPRGAHSLDDLAAIGRALDTVASDSEDSGSLQASNDELFSYFNAYYSVLLLYKIWWRDCGVLSMFVDRTTSEDKPNISDFTAVTNESAIDDNISAEQKLDDRKTKNTDNESEEEDTGKTPLVCSFSCGVSPSDQQLDLNTVLRDIQTVLLRENLATCATLRKQLLEVKKQVIVLRSRRILDFAAASRTSSAKQKRNPKKKNKLNQASKTPAESLGSTADVEEETKRNVPCDKNEDDVMTCDKNEDDVMTCDQNEDDVMTCDRNGDDVTEEDLREEDEKVFFNKNINLPPATFNVKEPLDVRYKDGKCSLEDMQSEEQRILTQLTKYPLKDLPFPDPVESAMVIGYMCGHVTGLPCDEPTVLHELGLGSVRWAARHAQWSNELKCLERLEKDIQMIMN